MKATTSQKIKTGIIVVVGTGILFITIFLIGKQKSLFSSTFKVHADYRNVSGLQIGNFVRFAGINIGVVNDITIMNDTTVRVDLTLQEKVHPFIKSDSHASIGSDGLMGDKLIQIGPGSDSGQRVSKDGAVIAVNPIDIDKIVAKLGGIANDAESITGSLAEILDKVNNGKGSLGRLLNDDKLSKSLESTIQSANQTVTTINKTAATANDDLQAAQHNFLLRGFFKKKEKKRLQDSTKRADSIINSKQNKKGQ